VAVEGSRAESRRAVLSHRSAADLQGLRHTDRARVDPGKRRRKRRGIDVHETTSLTAGDINVVDGIPCTAVARKLLDLAEVVNERSVELAIERPERRGLFDLRAVKRVVARADGRVGAGVVRRLISRSAWQPTLPRNELEELFLLLCRRTRVPQPEVNGWIPLDGDWVEADFLWRERRLVIETDGHETHGTRQAFENDRFRDQQLALAGLRVLRLTWRQVVDDPDHVAATLGQLVV
jgi:very-short-patch-repair endonuclease